MKVVKYGVKFEKFGYCESCSSGVRLTEKDIQEYRKTFEMFFTPIDKMDCPICKRKKSVFIKREVCGSHDPNKVSDNKPKESYEPDPWR